ncbi:MAG: FtsQ-type POTRA domain-containing protein [Saccharofermentans sp.]|nr:FtsQ-type POTRA domain-containing protein [Saccharofermentans sp.]
MSDENLTNEPIDNKELEVPGLSAEELKALDDILNSDDSASPKDKKEEIQAEKQEKVTEEVVIEDPKLEEPIVVKKQKEKVEPKKKITAKINKRKGKEYLSEFPYSFKSVVITLGVVSLIIFAWSIIFHPSMRIESIIVNGNYEFTDDEILDALDIHVGDHIWKFIDFNRRALIRSTPYIQGIHVSVDFPSQVTINVTERHKLAYISTPDGYIAIDAEGTVLEFVSSSENVTPVLCGLDVDNAVLGRTIEITDTLPFRKLILVLGAILDADNSSIRHGNYSFFNSVQEVRIVPSGMIFVTVALPDGTILQVKLAGIEDIAENMQWLLYSIKGGAFDDLPAGSLDMTQEEKIYHAYDT